MAKNLGLALTQEEMEKALQSNANGSYTGLQDPSLDFGNQNSFATEPSSTRDYTFELDNTGNTDLTIALCPAWHESVDEITDQNGEVVDAIICEGEVINREATGDDSNDSQVLKAKGLPKSIDTFLSYVKNHPTRIHQMRFKVSEESALNNPIYWKPLIPFAGASEFSNFTPANYTDENTQQANRATCDIQSNDFQFDCDTVVIYTIPAGIKVQITMLVGAIANDCLELRRKARFGRIAAAN